MADAIKNFVKVDVSTGYDDTAVTVVVATGQGTELPDPATANFNLTWWNSTDYADPSDDPNVEIVRVTAKTGDSLTVVRPAVGNSYNGETSANTAKTHNTGGKTYKMMLAPTYKVFNDINTDIAARAEAPVAAPGSDHQAYGIKITLTAGVAMNFGDVGYIASTGKVLLGDADAIATSSCVVMCADASIAQDAAGTFLLMGVARDDTWNWTVGGFIYLTVTGTTGNTLSQTAPTGTDDVTQILGIATHADRMFFNPQLMQTEHI